MKDMSSPRFKLVLVIDENLGIGLVSNTAAVLTLSVGAKHPELIGSDIHDASEQVHLGITTIPIPVLSTSTTAIQSIVQKLGGKEIELVSFSKIAQSIHSYDEYVSKLQSTQTSAIEYSGIALYGPEKAINSLVGSLPRLK